MGLFGFGKKKEHKEQKEVKKEFVPLERRTALRYLVEGLQTSLGEAIEVARNSIVVGVKGGFKAGDYIDITIDGEENEGEVVRVMPSKIVVKLQKPLDIEKMSRYFRRLQSATFAPCAINAQEELIQSDQELETNKAIVNLMLELDDPNTNIEKFTQNIDSLPKLKEMILKRANSIEKARGAKVETIAAAITRLGFEEIKRVVYEFINYEINLTNKTLPEFKDFETYQIFLNAAFKRLSAVVGFKDIKSEGQSLLSMSNVAAVLMSKKSPKLASFYRSPKELFGYEMRLLEHKELCTDLLEMNRVYFVETLKVFSHLFEGFAFANLMFHPYYEQHFTLMSGERKFRYAYLVYLTIAMVRFVLASDKYSGYLLFNRLKKFGLGLAQSKEMIDSVIEDVNKQLGALHIDKKIEPIQIPSALYSLGNFLGTGAYLDYFKAKLYQFDQESHRLALRYEDEHYSHFVLEKIINNDDFSLKSLPFVVIPCESLEDEDLPLDQFRSFDLLIFRNLHKLPANLHKDFEKIWRDFEGKIVVTFDTNSLLDIKEPALFEIIKNHIVDFPSYFQSAVLYQKMLLQSVGLCNRFVGQDVCDIAEVKDGMLTQKAVLVHCCQKV